MGSARARHPRPAAFLAILGAILLPAPLPCVAQPTAAPLGSLTPDQRSELLEQRLQLWQEAQNFLNAGQIDQAIQTGRQALRIDQQLVTYIPDQVEAGLNWLQSIHFQRSDFAAAELLVQQVHDELTRQLGADHWLMRTLQFELTHFQGYRQASETDRARLLKLENQLSAAYQSGDAQRTVKLASELIALEAAVFGADHPTRANTLQLQAEAQMHLGNPVLAEQALQQALAIRQQSLGNNHPDTATLLTALGQIRQNSGNLTAAAALYLQALEIRKRTLGTEHLFTADSMNFLGVAWFYMGKLDDAEQLYSSALSIQENIAGKESAVTATTLNNLGELYRLRGNYLHAESYYRRSLAISEANFGKMAPQNITALNNLAYLCNSLGRYADSDRIYRRAMAITAFTQGQQNRTYGQLVGNLAEMYRSSGRLGPATTLYAQALEIYRKTIGEHTQEYAGLLSSQALLHMILGEYREADELLSRAAQITREVHGEQHSAYAGILNALGLLRMHQGRYSDAERLYRQALTVRQETLGPEHVETSESLNNLAHFYWSLGDYVRAEPLYLQSRAILIRSVGQGHPSYARALNNLAALYQSMGDYSQAAELYQQALDIYEATVGQQHPDYVDTLHNVAVNRGLLGHFGEAEQAITRALDMMQKIFGPQHVRCAAALNSLSRLAVAQGDYDSAERYGIQAREILTNVLGGDHPQVAAAVTDLAQIYHQQKNFPRAADLYAESLQATRHLIGDAALALSERQQITLEQQARYRLDGYVALARDDPSIVPQVYQEVLQWKGAVLSRQRRYRQIADQPQLAPVLNELQQLTMKLASLSRAIPADSQQLDEWKAELTRLRDEKERLETELSRGSTLLDSNPQTAHWERLQSLLPVEAALVDYLEIQTPSDNDVGGLGLVLTVDDGLPRVAHIMAGSSADGKLRVGDRITALSVQGGEWVSLRGLPLSRVTAMLQGEVGSTVQIRVPADDNDKPRVYPLVRHSLGRLPVKRLVAFVVCHDRPVQLVDLGPIMPILEAVETWRATYGMSPEGRSAGRQLRESLWEPLLPHVRGADIVLISPDGGLGRLPFAALPGQQPDSYLLEEHRLAIIPVPQLLVAQLEGKSPPLPERGLLVMGGVDYDAAPGEIRSAPSPRPNYLLADDRRERSLAELRGGLRFTPLEATVDELRIIRDMFRDLTGEGDSLVTLEGARATEQQFRQQAPQCYFIHLATHGFFIPATSPIAGDVVSEQSPPPTRSVYGGLETQVREFSHNLLSGLAFTGANRPPQPDQDDGILTAEEIAFLPLESVRLVVLSACETGLGDIASGEGLLGVQRAFQVSGAQSTVASLWKVRDRVTQRLMARFYENLLARRMTRLDALREAQLWILNHPEQVRGLLNVEDQSLRRAPPYYWAAFCLSGHWR